MRHEGPFRIINSIGAIQYSSHGKIKVLNWFSIVLFFGKHNQCKMHIDSIGNTHSSDHNLGSVPFQLSRNVNKTHGELTSSRLDTRLMWRHKILHKNWAKVSVLHLSFSALSRAEWRYQSIHCPADELSTDMRHPFSCTSAANLKKMSRGSDMTSILRHGHHVRQ